MSYLISVLMTSFNREKFIAEAIESVLASTYNHFELIIADDCSTDKTVEIARSYAFKDKRIRIYVNEQNLGDYPNRNRAASYATGKYLKFVDSDDRLFPETLGSMIEIMEQFPGVGLGISDVQANTHEAYPVYLDARAAYLFHYFKRPIFFASPGLAIFTKETFDLIGGFPEKRMVGDFEMWHKLAQKTPIILLPGNLYWIRTHASQEVSEQWKFITDYEKIKIKYLFAVGAPLSEKEASEIIENRKATLLKIFVRKLMAFQFNEAALRLKAYCFYLRNFHHLKSQH